jgi:hypothetical protein
MFYKYEKQKVSYERMVLSVNSQSLLCVDIQGKLNSGAIAVWLVSPDGKIASRIDQSEKVDTQIKKDVVPGLWSIILVNYFDKNHIMSGRLNIQAGLSYLSKSEQIQPEKGVDIDTKPFVKSAKITTESTTIGRGDKKRLAGKVVGLHNHAKSLVWKLSGNKHKNTKINSSGLLIVSAKEKAKKLTVMAVSKLDNTKIGKIIVTVLKKTNAPGYKEIPISRTVKEGRKITLTAPSKSTLYYTLNGKKPTLKSKKVTSDKKKYICISKRAGQFLLDNFKSLLIECYETENDVSVIKFKKESCYL